MAVTQAEATQDGVQNAKDGAEALAGLFGGSVEDADKKDEEKSDSSNVEDADKGDAKDDAEKDGKVDGEKDSEDEKLGEGGVKALAAERTKNAELARQLAEFKAKEQAAEDAALPELDREKKRADRAETELDNLRKESLRKDVAIAKGLPSALAARLQGTTLEELEADADSLLALVAPPKKAAPKPDPSQGPSGTKSDTSNAAVFAEMFGQFG